MRQTGFALRKNIDYREIVDGTAPCLYNLSMSVKFVFLLIIFLVNTVATAIAESSHIELETHTSSITHSEDHHDHAKNSENSDDEHCPDHDECHDGHFHHYLVFSPTPFFVTTSFAYVDFPEIEDAYVSNSLEIIKPPLLLS